MLVSGRVWVDEESMAQSQAQATPPVVREFVQSVRTHPTDPERFGVLLSSSTADLEPCAYVGLVHLHPRYLDEDGGDAFLHEEEPEDIIEEEHGREEGFGSSSSSSSCGVSGVRRLK